HTRSKRDWSSDVCLPIYLRGHRISVGGGGLRRATGLAGLAAVSKRGYRVRLRGGANVGAAFQHRRIYFAGGQLWVGHGRPDRRGAAAVWHGKEQRTAELVLWPSGPETPYPAK